jgi:hypothetical protein
MILSFTGRGFLTVEDFKKAVSHIAPHLPTHTIELSFRYDQFFNTLKQCVLLSSLNVHFFWSSMLSEMLLVVSFLSVIASWIYYFITVSPSVCISN